MVNQIKNLNDIKPTWLTQKIIFKILFPATSENRFILLVIIGGKNGRSK